MSARQDPGDGPFEQDEVRDATQAALAAEHAVVWSYGLVSAFLPASVGAELAASAATHRDRRDAVEAMLERAGLEPVPGAASYQVPSPVDDATSAARLAVLAEEDVAAAWRAVLERTRDSELRRLGVDAVVASAVAAVRWRRVAGSTPLVPAFPGTSGA